MDSGEKLIKWVVVTTIVFILGQCVLSPILGIGTGALEEIGLGHFAAAITIIVALSDIAGFDFDFSKN